MARIQELNIGFTEKKDMADMISVCFRKPEDGDLVKAMNSQQMLQVIQREYPSLKINHSAKVHLGQAMKELGFEHTSHGNVQYYKAVPLRAA